MTLELEVFYIGVLCKYMNDLPHNTVKSFYISLLSVTNEEVNLQRRSKGWRRVRASPGPHPNFKKYTHANLDCISSCLSTKNEKFSYR